MLSVIMLIVYVWMVLLALQVIGFGLIASFLKQYLYDSGWGMGRIAIWLFLGLLVWFAAHFGIPVNTNVGVFGILLLLAGLSGYLIWKRRVLLATFFRKRWQVVIFQESLFALGLFGLSIIRSFNPKILDLEKFMDAGFMASYLRAATLPAADIWLAGETINYYSFGHFLGSIMTRVWNLPISYSYNLLLGFMMGLVFMLSFSVVVNLLSADGRSYVRKKALLVGGTMGALLVTVGGNTHTFWYWLTNRSWEGYWYADATRFIATTIHEFPSYSFVVSDIHAHVWGLPLVLSFLMIVIVWLRALVRETRLWQRDYLSWAGVMGGFIGIFVMTSAWDAMIFGLFLVILGGVVFIYQWQYISRLVASAGCAIASALVVAAPWLLEFESISDGVAKVTERSPLWQLGALWSGHIFLSGLGLMVALVIVFRWRTKRVPFLELMMIAMVVLGWTLLVLPELVYVKDIYSGHPRANTMFKLTYQGFVLMSLSAGWLFGTLVQRKKWHIGWRWGGLCVGLIVSSFLLLHPYFSYRDYYGRWNNFQGLDGYAWLAAQHPSDFAGIQWLEDSVSGQPVILEAVGDSYTTFDRVSVVTGLPTVLGWRVHEWLWRGGYDIPGQRTEEVKTIYTKPLSQESFDLLDRYDVSYIFVGDKEYEAYPNLSSTELKRLGSVVFEQGGTFIVKRSLQSLR